VAVNQSAHASTVVLEVYNIRSFSGPNVFLYEQFISGIYDTFSILVYLHFHQKSYHIKVQSNLLVLKLLSESCIFSVVFAINFSGRKLYIYVFLKTGFSTPDEMFSVTKWNESIPGERQSLYLFSKACGEQKI